MNIKTTFSLLPFGLLIIGALYSCGNQNKLNENNNTESEVKPKKSGLDKSAMNAIGSRCNVDMSQFAKTELYVPYANTDNPRQILDIVYPTIGEAPYKTIVLIHGGGWLIGNK